ncbi:MAG: hypothetical protein ACJ76H_08955 [Bacteriovoracaceae bacterium]
MKTIFVTFGLLLSLSAVADDTVLTAMKKLFENGAIMGRTPKNEMCRLEIRFHDNHADVFAAVYGESVSRIIPEGSGYRLNLGTREFLSSDSYGTFRTLAVDERLTYTVTSEWKDGKEKSIECIVNIYQ